MSEKKHIHSDGEPCQCESLKDQIQSIKEKALEDCKARNEEAKEKNKALESKMTKMLVASTVAFTLIGQEAVEKIEPFIGKITALLGGDTSVLTAPETKEDTGGAAVKTTSQEIKFNITPKSPLLDPSRSKPTDTVSSALLLNALEALDRGSSLAAVGKDSSPDRKARVIDLPSRQQKPTTPESDEPVVASAQDLFPAANMFWEMQRSSVPPLTISSLSTTPVTDFSQPLVPFPGLQATAIPAPPSSTLLLAGLFHTRKR